MKIGIQDRIIDKLLKQKNLVQGKLAQQYKSQKPCTMEPSTPAEQLYTYNQITPEIMMAMRQQMGDEVVDKYVEKMNKIQVRYQR